MFEVFSDRADSGWVAEVVFTLGSTRQVMFVSSTHDQPYEAEQEAASAVQRVLRGIFSAGLAEHHITEEAAAAQEEEKPTERKTRSSQAKEANQS